MLAGETTRLRSHDVNYAVVLVCENRPGILESITDIIAHYNINILQVYTWTRESITKGLLIVESLNDEIVEKLRRVEHIIKVTTFPILKSESECLITLSTDVILSTFSTLASVVGDELAISLIYRIAYEYGRAEYENYFKISKPIQLEKFMMFLNYLIALNWIDDYRIDRFGLDEVRIIITTTHAYNPAMSHYIRGFLSGFLSAMFGKDFTCNLEKISETEYLAKLMPYKS